MKNKRPDFSKSHHKGNDADLMFKKVKWREDGITHLGDVTEIYSVKGIKYLKVMTIYGKRCTVRMSKVKLYSEQLSKNVNEAVK